MDTDNNEKQAIAYIQAQRDKIEELLRITQDTVIPPSLDGIEIFANMVNKREAVLDEIKAIQETLESPELAQVWQNPQSDAFNTEAARVRGEIQLLLRQLEQCEKANSAICQNIQNELRKGLKDISNQRSVNTYYQYDQSVSRGSYFDKKK